MQLSGTQIRLAHFFLSNIGRILSRDHFFAMVPGREFRETTRTVHRHVSRLRLLFEIGPVDHFRLQLVYKGGYGPLHLYDDGKDACDDRMDTEHGVVESAGWQPLSLKTLCCVMSRRAPSGARRPANGRSTRGLQVTARSHFSDVRRVERLVGQPKLHALEAVPGDFASLLPLLEERRVPAPGVIHRASLQSSKHL